MTAPDDFNGYRTHFCSVSPSRVSMPWREAAITTALLFTTSLAGCAALDAHSETAATPAESSEVTPTGRTVELDAWAENVEQELWRGFTGKFWAFCFEPRPGSEDAVEYVRPGEKCSVPGPTIRVDQGDRVVVNFRNPHDFPHTIHWHGQLVPNDADGVPGVTQDTVTPGNEYRYEFLAKREGSLMYHCHVDTQHHVFMGLYGAFIVEPQDKSHEPEVDRDVYLMLSHANRTMMDAKAGGHHGGTSGMDHGGGGMSSGEPGKQNGAFDPEFDVYMINGRSFPLTVEDPASFVKVREGERVRMRLANIGYLAETMHLHGHDMLVTHKDGLPLPDPYYVDTLPILPGERYDVVIEANNPGKWVFHTHYPTHVSNDHQYPGGMLTQFVYEGHEDQKFQAELPGGQPGGGMGGHEGMAGMGMNDAPPEMEMFTYRQREEGNVTAVDYRERFTFPVESTYANRLTINATLTQATQVDELTLTLRSAQGEVLSERTLSAAAPAATLEVDEFPDVGDYVVELSGRGVGASFRIEIAVEYVRPVSQGAEPSGGGGHH